MRERTFLIALCITLGVCIALTAAHVLYAIEAYEHCSIIPFVAKELW